MKDKRSLDSMSSAQPEESTVGLVDLADALDAEGMIGFTQAFVITGKGLTMSKNLKKTKDKK